MPAIQRVETQEKIEFAVIRKNPKIVLPPGYDSVAYRKISSILGFRKEVLVPIDTVVFLYNVGLWGSYKIGQVLKVNQVTIREILELRNVVLRDRHQQLRINMAANRAKGERKMCKTCYYCDQGSICANLFAVEDCDGSSRFAIKKVTYKCNSCGAEDERVIVNTGPVMCRSCTTLVNMSPTTNVRKWKEYVRDKGENNNAT